MNKFLLSTTLIFSINAFAQDDEEQEGVLNKAPVVLAGVAAMEAYKKSFELNGSTLGSELVGFTSKKAEENAKASVYKIPEAAKLKNANYDCQYNRDANGELEGAKCEDAGESEARDYTAAQGSFSAEEFKKAAEKAVAVFETALGDPKKIEEAQFWRSYVNNEANIQVKFVWIKDDGTQATNLMLCHYHQHGHGDELELGCHRHREAGPFQP